MNPLDARNALVLELEKTQTEDHIKHILSRYDCASDQWERALIFAVKLDYIDLLKTMVGHMHTRREGCDALFFAVSGFKDEAVALLAPYSGLSMAGLAAVDDNNIWALNFLMNLFSQEEKIYLLWAAAGVCNNLQAIEALIPHCNFRDVLQRHSQSLDSYRTSSAWQYMEDLGLAHEIKRSLNQNIDGVCVEATNKIRKI